MEMVEDSKTLNNKAAISRRPPLPGDHGAYAMLLLPLVIGFAVGAMQGLQAGVAAGPPFILLTLFFLAVFFASDQIEIATKRTINPAARFNARAWLGIYLVVAAVTGLPLLLLWQLWGLLWFILPAALPLVALLLSRRWRKQRSLPVRYLGIAGLTLSAPVAFYVATGRLDTLTLGLWLLCFFYFGSSLFYVHIWFEAKKNEKLVKLGRVEKLVPNWLTAVTLFYHLAGFAILALPVLAGWLPWTVFLVFLPLVVKLVMCFRRPPIYIPIKQVGLYEFAQSFVFTVLLLLALR